MRSKLGVDIQLDPRITLTGRVVDLVTKQPIAGMMVTASAGKTNFMPVLGFQTEDMTNVTDETGHFSLERAPVGTITIIYLPKDWRDGAYSFSTAFRDVTGTGTFDVGDLTALQRRTKPSDPVRRARGELEAERRTPTRRPRSAHLSGRLHPAPDGPAAHSGLVVGDIVTSIDGLDGDRRELHDERMGADASATGDVVATRAQCAARP